MSKSKLTDFLSRNSGPILTGVSIISFGVAIWRTYVSSPRVHDILDDAKEDWHEAKTAEERKRNTKHAVKEVVKETWPIVLSFGVGTAAEIFNVKRYSHEIDKYALMWATERSFKNRYINEVRKEVGENKEREIHDRAVASYANDIQPINVNLNALDGDWIIYDSVTDQTFISNESKVTMALSKVNNRKIHEMSVDYLDFLMEIGEDISKVPDGVKGLVWDVDQGIVEPVWEDGHLGDTRRPISILSYSVMPKEARRSMHDY